MNSDWSKWDETRERTACFFSNRCDSFEHSYEAANWGSRKGQVKRFEVLTGIADLNDRSILDIGCGQGDFASFLIENGIIPRRFVGLDISDRMVEIASRRDYGGLRADFYCASFHEFDMLSQTFDYIFASGIFYRIDKDPYEYLERTVTHFFRSAILGTAFNTLYEWKNEGTGHSENQEFLPDPTELLKIVNGVTCSFVLRCDYHPRDLTFYIYKQEGLV